MSEQKIAFLEDLKLLLKKHNAELISYSSFYDDSVDYNFCISGKYDIFIEMEEIIGLTKKV